MEFPPTFVINLADRTDRLQSIRTSFSNWPVPIQRIDAVHAKPGWKGCIRSHKKALELCKEKGYPYAIILEDDCVLTEKGKDTFLQLLPTLIQRSSEWDVFLGGVTNIENVNVKNKTPPLFELDCYTTHFCLFNANGINKVLKDLNENEPYDVFLRKNMRIWCTSPHIAVQVESRSDIEDKNVNYNDVFEKSNTILSTLLNTKESNKSLFFQLFLFTSVVSVVWLMKR